MKLSEIVENITIGDWGNENYSDEAPIAVHCIRSADIVPYYNNIFDGIPIRYVTSRSFNTRVLKEGDIIIEKSGGTNECSTGRVMYVSDELLEHNEHKLICSNFCASFRVKSEWNAKFVYYFIRLVHQCGVFHNYEGKTSGIHNLQMENAFKAIDLPSITFDDQKKAADVLSTIERKISLNRSINKELEEIAKEIYDYWFVQFDFPDANGRPYKSSGGSMVYNTIIKRDIPEVWKVEQVSKICKTKLGGTPDTSKNEYWNGDFRWLNSGEVAEFPIVESEKSITQEGIDGSATSFLKAGSITLSITRHLRPSILAIDACINQSVVGIEENDIYKKSFIYPYLSREIPRLMTLRVGAQQPHINKETVDISPIVVPPVDILKKYYEKVEYIYALIISNALQIKDLKIQRKELLPLLMTGQVKIK